MRISRPGSKKGLGGLRGFSTGSILVDAIVAVLIVATLGVAVVSAIGTTYANLSRYDQDLRDLLSGVRTAYAASW